MAAIALLTVACECILEVINDLAPLVVMNCGNLLDPAIMCMVMEHQHL